MQKPRDRHRHRELHDLGRLEADDSQIQPALRALADVSNAVDDEQQEDADRVQPGRCAAQEVRIHLGEQQHRGRAECEAPERAIDDDQALARGAVENDQAIHRHQGESDDQRAIELQLKQNSGRAGQGASGSGAGGDFFVNHAVNPFVRLTGPERWPASGPARRIRPEPGAAAADSD